MTLYCGILKGENKLGGGNGKKVTLENRKEQSWCNFIDQAFFEKKLDFSICGCNSILCRWIQ
jgi:hypothetical protein